MPIVLAVLAGFLLGVAFAWMARVELGRVDGPVVASRAFTVVLGFAALVYGPLVGYFVAFHGDWTYGYAVAWHRVPSAVDLALVLLAGASVLIGVVAAAHAARARRLNAVAWLAAVPAAGFALALAWGGPRLAVSATYAQYHGGFGVLPIGAAALGRAILVMGAVLALGLGWAVRALAQDSSERDEDRRGGRREDL